MLCVLRLVLPTCYGHIYVSGAEMVSHSSLDDGASARHDGPIRIALWEDRRR